MLKSGLIVGAVMLVLSLGGSLITPLCVPCLALIVGIGAGYLAGTFDKPLASGASAQVGAGAGAIAGVGALASHRLSLKSKVPVMPSPIFGATVLITAIAGCLTYLGKFPGLTLFVFVTGGWIISLCLHEFGRALLAWLGEDKSVADKGYLTLNPVKYTHGLFSIVFPRDANVSSQYLGVGAGLAPAQAGNRKGLPLLFEKIHANLLLSVHLA
jgi:hypothetical protein